jgi:beta-mannosidase
VAKPLSNQLIGTLTFPLTLDERRAVLLLAELRQGEQRIAMTVAAFVPNKHLKLTDPRLTLQVEQQGENAVVAVTAQSFARFVEVSVTGADVIFSDNYFDVPAGWTIEVHCPLPAGWTVAQLRDAVSVRSLYDSF